MTATRRPVSGALRARESRASSLRATWKGRCRQPRIREGRNSEWVRMYFDVGNVIYMGLGHPEQWIREVGKKYITRIHFKDAQRSEVKYLLEGQVNWPAVRDAMRAIEYNDWVGVELNQPAAM